MIERTARELPELLDDWVRGEPAALDRVGDALRGAWRREVERQLDGGADVTLRAAAFVGRGLGGSAVPDRLRLLAVAAAALRGALEDVARDHRAARLRLVPLRRPLPGGALDLGRLLAALARLADLDPERARIAELRTFGGLSCDEVADVLGCSFPTARRGWRAAQGWLHRTLLDAGHGADSV